MLATVPSNLKSPQWLAEQAEELADEAGLRVEVWDEKRAGHARASAASSAVGQGSATPPRLIRLDYTPRGGRKAPRVVLVGKGITFDTGGLSIKPAEAHVDHEARHDRRRRGDVGAGGARPRSAARCA